MSPRDTGTGAVLEQMIIPALKRGKYEVQTQVEVGDRLGGGKHKIDVLAQKEGELPILISAKWQQVSGTAEQKVVYEVISLADIMLKHSDKYKSAYLVIAGTNWKLKDYYISGALKEHLLHADLVNIISLEDFIVEANNSFL